MKHRVKFLQPTLGHVRAVALSMREIDRIECETIGGHDPETALRNSIKRSEWAVTAEVDDEPICIFGVAPVTYLGDAALPWMLGTDGIERHNRLVLRHSRRWVDKMIDSYPRLCNIVHADNEVSIRWLQWCGFRIDPPTVIQGEPFRPFSKVRLH